MKYLSGVAKYCLLAFSAAYLVSSYLGLSPARAQEPRVAIETRARSKEASTGSAARVAPDFRINTDLVLIPVMVTDKHDRLITGLEKTHFKLFEDKVEQVITHFAAEDVPVSITIVFDSSGSMSPKMEKARSAVAAFLRNSNPDDEFSLIEFNDRARLVSGFTTSTEEIQNRVMFIRPTGQTALLDAVYLALNEMGHARNQRKAVMIISDGGDNHSRYSLKEVKNFVRETDTQVYSIGIVDLYSMNTTAAEEMRGPALLSDVAAQTGGRFFEVTDLNQLAGIASKIGTALRNQYVLGYAPAPDKRDGKYHKVQVKIDRPKGVPALRASFRAGYVAPAF